MRLKSAPSLSLKCSLCAHSHTKTTIGLFNVNDYKSHLFSRNYGSALLPFIAVTPNKIFYSAFHEMAPTPRELDGHDRAAAEFVRTTFPEGGCRTAPQHSGKFREEVTESCCQTSRCELPFYPQEESRRHKRVKTASAARVINSPRNGVGLVPKLRHLPGPGGAVH